MPRYSEGTWQAILGELYYSPARRELLLTKLRELGEPGRVLSWADFKDAMVMCIHGMYGESRVKHPAYYTPEALEDNSGAWQKLHGELTEELERQAATTAEKKESEEKEKRDAGGGILADGSPVSIALAQELLGLGPNNAQRAIGCTSLDGDVTPTFARGRRTFHVTVDDLDGQGEKDSKHTGKKKITYFYDEVTEGAFSRYYLAGWGVHVDNTQYQLIGVVPPVTARPDPRRQWTERMIVSCGTQKK